MPLTAGTRLGPYEIVAAIGAGGMGEVYRARDTKLGRDVALKVLPESFAADPDRLARFHREAQVLGALNHPNIAQIYGFEDSGATHALVMELVDGQDLSQIISGSGHLALGSGNSTVPVPSAKSRVPLSEALAIARQISAALEAAHEQGIVHRDLKPANVKVREDGTVKVLDFGLAKALDPTASSSADVMNSPTLTARATQFGMILGTAAYMAPEQAKGKAVDRRADIWAFGVVLFEMLSGERAFKGDDVSEVLASVLRQEIDWKALPADTPVKVRRVLEHCLERDPKRRLRDIGDVWLGMDAPDESASASIVAPPAPRTSSLSRWLPWAVATVIAAGSIAWAVSRTPEPAPQLVTRSAQTLKDNNLFVTVSRDGTRLAYVGTGGRDTGIVVRMVDQFEGRILPGTDGGVFPVFSPDGQWIAFSDPGMIKKVQVTGGPAVVLCGGSFAGGAAWGDNNTIIFPSGKGLMRVSADGGTPEALTTLDASKGETVHMRPQFLPGGRQLLFTVMSPSGTQFAILDLDTRRVQNVAKGGMNGRYVASGHLTYVRGTTLFAAPFDLSRRALTGSEIPVVEGISTIGPSGTADYSVSDAGLLAYFTGGDTPGTTLAWADRAGVTKPLPGHSTQLWGTGRLSPDGRLIANGISNSNGVRDIWTFDVERGTLARLTFGEKQDVNDHAIWTADSRRVFYSGSVDGKPGLYVVPADGSSKPALVLSTDAVATPTSVAPDGKTLFYHQGGVDKGPRILALTLDEKGLAAGQPRPLHDAVRTELDAQISPDGHWVAYVSSESGALEVYVLPFPGPGPKIGISLAGGNTVRWSRDGRELLYWANVPTSTLMAVDVSTSPVLRAGTPRELFRQSSTTTWDVTPDRNRFLIELSSRTGGSTLAIVTNWLDELRRRAPAKK